MAGIRRAIRAIEAGSVDPADYDTVGDEWDIEGRAMAELAARWDQRLGAIKRLAEAAHAENKENPDEP